MNTAITWEKCESNEDKIVMIERTLYKNTETDNSSRRAFFNRTSSHLTENDRTYLCDNEGDGDGKIVDFPTPIIEPVKKAPNTFFSIKRSWVGYVLEVYEDGFLARLVDPKDKRPDEEAEFSFDEINDYDRELVEDGAVFYWNVGYQRTPSGSNERASSIHFRRLPVWSDEELKAAKVYGQWFSQKFKQTE